MKIGTSLRFLFPGSEHTLKIYQHLVSSMPAGSFIERPMGEIDNVTQAKNLIEAAQAAHEAGCWTVMVGDNHSIQPAYAHCFQPVPTIARLTAVTGNTAVGAVFLAPFYQPALLAEQIATISAFSGTDTYWLFVAGGRQGAFDAFNIPMRERGKRTEEMVTTIRPLLAGESVSVNGRGWGITDAIVSPKLEHNAYILLGGSAPAAIERAARLGDGWVTAQNASDEELAKQLIHYRKCCEEAGSHFNPILRRDIYVAETDKQALNHIQPILEEGYRGVGLNQLLVGNPDSIVKRLKQYHNMGFDRVLVRHVTANHQAMLNSFDLIGREIIPAVAQWSDRNCL